MKAIRVLDFGGPEVLILEEVPDLNPREGEVLVRVGAVGVNPVDAYIRNGAYGNMVTPPYTPGSDAAGTIEAVGDGVNEYSIGDRVYTDHTVKGAYAEFIVAKTHQVHPLPDNVSFAQGAALGVPYATAHRALFGKAGAKTGDYVLVHGASGGVGIAAVQLALHHDMQVIATAGTPESRRKLEEMGAQYVLDHNDDEHFADAHGATCGHGVDVVLEMLANINLGRDLPILAKNGRVVVVGSRGEVTINPRDTMSRDAQILGILMFNTPNDELMHIHHDLVEGLRDGWLSPFIHHEYALGEAAQAHQAVLQNGTWGKIVLVP
jgi:NADPH2:quinone reductase